MALGDMSGWGLLENTDNSNLSSGQIANILNYGNQNNSGGLGSLGGSGFGLNLGTAQLGLGAIGTLGNLYMGISQLGLAKKSFNLQKAYANANYTNQAKAYNTNLTDRITSRGVAEGLSQAQVNDYINKNSVSTSL